MQQIRKADRLYEIVAEINYSPIVIHFQVFDFHASQITGSFIQQLRWCAKTMKFRSESWLRKSFQIIWLEADEEERKREIKLKDNSTTHNWTKVRTEKTFKIISTFAIFRIVLLLFRSRCRFGTEKLYATHISRHERRIKTVKW